VVEMNRMVFQLKLRDFLIEVDYLFFFVLTPYLANYFNATE